MVGSNSLPVVILTVNRFLFFLPLSLSALYLSPRDMPRSLSILMNHPSISTHMESRMTTVKITSDNQNLEMDTGQKHLEEKEEEWKE